MAELKKENSFLEMENKNLKKNLVLFKDEELRKNDILKKIEAENFTLKNECNDLRKKLAESEGKILELGCKLDATNFQYKTILGANEIVVGECEKLKGMLDELNNTPDVMDVLEANENCRQEIKEMESKLQKLQNKIDNGLRVEVDFRGRDNMLPVVELADEDCTRFDEYGVYVGRVMLE